MYQSQRHLKLVFVLNLLKISFICMTLSKRWTGEKSFGSSRLWYLVVGYKYKTKWWEIILLLPMVVIAFLLGIFQKEVGIILAHTYGGHCSCFYTLVEIGREGGVYMGKVYMVQGLLVMLRQKMELSQMWHGHTTNTTAKRAKRTDDDRGDRGVHKSTCSS